MDVPEADFDIKLQKISADLIAELDTLLPSLIFKAGGSGGTKVRSRVRARELDSLIQDVGADNDVKLLHRANDGDLKSISILSKSSRNCSTLIYPNGFLS